MRIKLRRPTWLEMACVVVLLAIGLAVFYPLLFLPGRPDRSTWSGCIQNEKQLALGLHLYAEENDRRLPNALEWPRAITPYVRSERLLHCPKDVRWMRQEEGMLAGPRSYDMLQRWSDQHLLRDADEAASAIVLYEIGDLGLVYRHNDGVNVGFMDGHVKWFTREAMLPQMILKGAVPREGVAAR